MQTKNLIVLIKQIGITYLSSSRINDEKKLTELLGRHNMSLRYNSCQRETEKNISNNPQVIEQNCE